MSFRSGDYVTLCVPRTVSSVCSYISEGKKTYGENRVQFSVRRPGAARALARRLRGLADAIERSL